LGREERDGVKCAAQWAGMAFVSVDVYSVCRFST
jgi:hypothetical protein